MNNTISKNDFEKIVLEANSKSEIAKRLGYTFFNGKIGRIVDSLLSEFGTSIDHFDRGKARRKYEIINKICPICSKEFDTQKDHPKEKSTCSIGCSNSFQPKQNSEESRTKTSLALLEHYKANPHKLAAKYKCKICSELFRKRNKFTITCSKKCAIEYRNSFEFRNNLRTAAIRRVNEGRNPGWVSRSKIKPSFPEQYTQQILEKEFQIHKNVDYAFEQKCGKWFIDFAFNGRKIALEIDGKQHELPERKASDIEKDKFLVEQGWTVHRIKWKRIKTKKDRENFISIISDILK